MKIDKAPMCPHCGKECEKYETPIFHFADGLGWGTPFLYVCFNEECPLYVRGKKHMMEKYGQAATYRYMVYPDTGLEDVMVAANPNLLEKRMKALKSVPDDSKE
ncbi:MAG: hypothetical protein Q7T83_02590 [Thermodesulfovibrionales bacterium]|nr:hypothetical protein [Thermodesulfovibrionales bacterium]MDP3111375.1 hypothetical protein [Thermodesulfovibrionales bacterium]